MQVPHAVDLVGGPMWLGLKECGLVDQSGCDSLGAGRHTPAAMHGAKRSSFLWKCIMSVTSCILPGSCAP